MTGNWLGGLAKCTVVLTALTTVTAGALAAKPAAPAAVRPNAWANPDPAHLLFENKIEPGMTGYGLTVMHGDAIQKFYVRIVDVMKNFGPDMNVILVRCHGLGLRHSGIIEGMSGSPVFINGKLIGAIAYGWSYSKDPIGGVQPIRQMLGIPLPPPGRHGAAGAGAGGAAAGNPVQNNSAFGGDPAAISMLRHALRHNIPGWAALAQCVLQRSSVLMPNAITAQTGPGRLVPLASPLMAGGASPEVVRYLQQAYAGSDLTPMAAGGAGAGGPNGQLGGWGELRPGAVKLTPGSAISVPLMSGDLDLAAIGTVTDIFDGHLYAFGHRFFAQGPTSLPIATAYIYTIIPGVKTSFKLGATDQIKGRLLMDQATGIVGQIGKPITSVPVTISVHSRSDAQLDQTFHYQLYPNFNATLQSAVSALLAATTAHRKLGNHYTVHVTGNLSFASGTIPVDEVFGNPRFKPDDIMLPLAVMLGNPFHRAKLTGIRLHVTISRQDTNAQILSVKLNRRVVAPGDSITARVTLLLYGGSQKTIVLPLRIPVGTPDGSYHLVVGSADLALTDATRFFPESFNPQNQHQLVQSVRTILSFKTNRLYGRLILNPAGVATSAVQLPDLPASRVALLALNQSSNSAPLYNHVEVSAPAGAVVGNGGEIFHIVVRRRANSRYLSLKPGMPPVPPPGN